MEQQLRGMFSFWIMMQHLLMGMGCSLDGDGMVHGWGGHLWIGMGMLSGWRCDSFSMGMGMRFSLQHC